MDVWKAPLLCLLLWATISEAASQQSIPPLSFFPTGTEYEYSYRSTARLIGNLNVTLDATVSIRISEPVRTSRVLCHVRAAYAVSVPRAQAVRGSFVIIHSHTDAWPSNQKLCA